MCRYPDTTGDQIASSAPSFEIKYVPNSTAGMVVTVFCVKMVCDSDMRCSVKINC